MALNLTGPISLGGATTGQSIAVELGLSPTGAISLNQTNVRTLAGVASGAIIMPTNFYGKSNTATASYTFATNTANASLNITSLSGYVAGNTNVTITVNSGVYLYATSSATPGLTLTGGQSGDTITLVNNGYIMGQGGAGASWNAASGAGGPALKLGYNTTINNTNASAYIGGGGGGAGNGSAGGKMGGGGGAGGGAGGSSWAPYNTPSTASGGAGGGVGASGSNGGAVCCFPGDFGTVYGAGGGGGRILPGTGGSTNTTNWLTPYGYGGGSGGGGGSISSGCQCDGASCGVYGFGGSGGSAGAVGGNSSGGPASGGGGGWGASGGSSTSGALYGSSAGGKAVCLNGKTVTWTSGCTTRVYGVVS